MTLIAVAPNRSQPAQAVTGVTRQRRDGTKRERHDKCQRRWCAGAEIYMGDVLATYGMENYMAVATDYEIEFVCGHSEVRDLSAKPAGERKGYAAWLERSKCTDCWKRSSTRQLSKEVQAARDAAQKEAIADQERNGLPILQGSTKQAAWALKARYLLLKAAYEDLVEIGEMGEEQFEETVLEPARVIDRAKWWIDNREYGSQELLQLLADPGGSASGTVSENPY